MRYLNLPNEIIAVTGPIASGKTTYCEELKAKGCTVIHADKIVKRIYKKETVINFLCLAMSRYRLQAPLVVANEVNFKEVRRMFCSNEHFKKEIEELISSYFDGEFLKEYIERELYRQKNYQRSTGTFEDGSLNEYETIYFEYAPKRLIDVNLFDGVIELDVYKEEQLKRIMKRDGCTEEIALRMIELVE